MCLLRLENGNQFKQVKIKDTDKEATSLSAQGPVN